MSLLPQSIYMSPGNLISGISENLNASTIQTTTLRLDNNLLDTTGSGSNASLLLNGITIAGNTGLASTIANWSYFPAISTISFATSVGTGGNIIMSNVSTVNLQSQIANIPALTVSSLNGAIYPNLGATGVLPVQITTVGPSGTATLNFSALPSGIYYVSVLWQNTADPMSASAVIRYVAGIAGGGSYHQPVISGTSSSANYVSIQSDLSGDANIQIYCYSQAFQNQVVQMNAYRLL